MFAMSRLALAAILFLGMSLVFMPSYQVRAGVTAGPAKKPAIASETDQAAKPAKTITRKPAEPAGRVMKLNKETMKKLNTLPKSQRIMVKGKEMTVGEFKVQSVREQKQAITKIKTMRATGTPDTDGALQKEFDRKDEARLTAANAKVAAEMAKLKKSSNDGNGASEAEIKREAAEIQKRMNAGTSTPQDEDRARQLYQEYQALQ